MAAAASVLCGRTLSTKYLGEIRERVVQLGRHGIVPGLTVVQVGDLPASTSYIRMKQKSALEVGMNFRHCHLPAETTSDQLLAEIDRVNNDPSVHGLIVQLPLPSSIPEQPIIDAVAHAKDVDGFHILNVGALARGSRPLFVPCTPRGVMALLDSVPGLQIRGARAVVIGRSNIVGKPVASLLLARDASVQICHSRTANLADEVRRADIVVAAVGRAHMVQADWIKPGAVVIDVGTNSIPDASSKTGSRLVGDVHPDVQKVASFLTPVPGGVGPMTVCMLLQNTLESAERLVQ